MKEDVLDGRMIHFKALDGIWLAGLLIPSRKNNRLAVIHVFGMSGNFFLNPTYGPMCDALKGSDYDMFFANNRGMGSVMPFRKDNGKKRLYYGTAAERFEDCIYDIGGAIRALGKLGYKGVVLQGHSTGCQKIAYYQYKKADGRVMGLVLLAPADDYIGAKKDLGKKFGNAVKIAKTMVRRGHGKKMTPEWISHYTAKRFLSYAVRKNPEARMFDYNSDLGDFKRITCPILAVFGSREEYRDRPVKEYMKLLEERTSSEDFTYAIINGADHGFRKKEEELANVISGWIRGLD